MLSTHDSQTCYSHFIVLEDTSSDADKLAGDRLYNYLVNTP
ncbi:MAG: hypothetical protein CLLPBCKN_001960 [Chroococcidiopsis cubana SAG 39.79]|uniref:Uncharacterized protein n=1 Tax=Chroococcidiopsis thermalis (strain PCC 7203) TaxID=251229 RepID=K9U0Q9_CHRTP|nr:MULTISPECIES: hypothetical protein [Chroococcidiopsis]AFY88031.1 hypothetical protein Chro_2553 [Chroococcidiopsis thermalis PCC 7203]MDZ4872572.1 hypothetical protein [Chroococcidiopsis cubana SAG 39.79]